MSLGKTYYIRKSELEPRVFPDGDWFCYECCKKRIGVRYTGSEDTKTDGTKFESYERKVTFGPCPNCGCCSVSQLE